MGKGSTVDTFIQKLGENKLVHIIFIHRINASRSCMRDFHFFRVRIFFIALRIAIARRHTTYRKYLM